MQRSILRMSLAVLIVCAACASRGSTDEESPIRPDGQAKPKAPLTFRITGQAQEFPESVIIHFAVVGDGDTLSAAEQQVQKTEQAIVCALATQAVTRKYLQLERFAAIPLQPGGASSTASMKPLGYRVERRYTIGMPVTGNSLDKALKVADAALSQGARPVMTSDTNYDAYNRRQSSLMEFVVKDREKLTKDAMADALAQARKLAEQAAAEMGRAPGDLRLIAVRVTDAGFGPGRYDSQEDRTPLTSPFWQTVRATVLIEAEYDLK